MEVEKYLRDRIGILKTDVNPLMINDDIEFIIDSGFQVLVTVADYDFNISWRVGSPVSIRHYQCTFGTYPEATKWELQHLNEYFLYELFYSRNIALWCEDIHVENAILKSIGDFFQPDGKPLADFIRTKLDSQYERTRHIPEKLNHCKACNQQGCITDLMCHVSSVEDAEQILKTGEILSAVESRHKTGTELNFEDRNAAGDPPDYFEYVMFTFGNCFAGDRLVMERALGMSPTQEDLIQNFYPGVRFYFKYADLIRHPRFRSDGYHYCKIKDSINLDDYLITTIAPESARPFLLKRVDSKLVNRLTFLNEYRYADLYSWSQKAYEIVAKSQKTRT